MRKATLAHKDTLNILKGYPNVILPGDLHFSFDGGTIAIDGFGHYIYPENDITTTYPLAGPFKQAATIIEIGTTNLTTDSDLRDGTNWNSSPVNFIISDEVPIYFSGTIEKSIFINNGTQATISSYHSNMTDPFGSSGKATLSCWLRTDATAVRFIFDSSISGLNYDDYIIINTDKWTHIYSKPFNVQAGEQLRQFYIETSSNATFLKVFHPQLELNPFPTSWVDDTRANGILNYKNSYFTPKTFSISGWFYINFFNDLYNGIFSICSGLTNFNILKIFTDNSNNNAINIYGANNNIILLNYSGAQIQQNKWNHFAITFNGLKYNFYLNGYSVYEVDDVRQLEFLPDSKIYIGTLFDQYFLNGMVSDFIISGRYFSEELVRNIYINEMPLYNPYSYVGQV